MRKVCHFIWTLEPYLSSFFLFYFRTVQTRCHFLFFTEDALANLPEDATLELVWKNNERLKEYVLVSSKDLDYEEDPSSLSETARAGHFSLEQCLNLFTKPEVLAPEEAW